MGEVIAAFGATAAFAQLLAYGFKGASGIHDISSRARSAPLTLHQWHHEVESFRRLISELKADPLLRDSEAHAILRRFEDEATTLKPRLEELSIGARDSRLTRWRKAFKLVFREKEIGRKLSSFRHGSESLHRYHIQYVFCDHLHIRLNIDQT